MSYDFYYIIPFTKIKDYKVFNDKVVLVEFEDGTTTKAVCSTGDKFDLDMGLTVCMIKRIMGEEGYKKMLKQTIKNHNQKIIDEEKKKEEEKLWTERRQKIRDKKAKAKREKQISVIEEAFVRANNRINQKEYERFNCNSQESQLFYE